MSNSLQLKRIITEQKEIDQNRSDVFYANPIEDNIFVWHFTVIGPQDSPYENGLYHGKIELSQQYPLKPPDFYFLNPNGRFEINEKICLNFTKFHPENWNPSFTIRSILEGLVHYFPLDDQIAGVGSLIYSKEERKKLAILSHKWKCEHCGPLKDIFQNQFRQQNNIKIQKNEDVQQNSLNEQNQKVNLNEQIQKDDLNEQIQKNITYLNEQIKKKENNLNDLQIQDQIKIKLQQQNIDIQQQKIHNFILDKRSDQFEIPFSNIQNDILFKNNLIKHIEIFQILQEKNNHIQQSQKPIQTRQPKQVDQKQKDIIWFLNIVMFVVIILILTNIYN